MMLDKTRQDYVYVGDNQSILQKNKALFERSKYG